MAQKRISVQVDKDFHYRIKVKAALDNVNIADVVRELLEKWLSQDEVLTKNAFGRDAVKRGDQQ